MASIRATTGERQSRLDRFFAGLARLGADGALASRREDVHYLTGYTGSDAVALFSLRKRGGWLITDARYREEGEKTAPGVEVLLWKGGFASFVGALCKKQRMKHVGYAPAAVSVAFYNALRGNASPVRSWRDIDPLLAGLRAVKGGTEIAAIEKALRCAEEAFLAARRRWKAGMAEKEVKDDLEWEMRRRGAADAAFETIVAAGANASLPHAHAGDRKLAPRKMLLIDFGARVGFYNSDLTRTLWLGEIPKVWRSRYRAVLAAQRAGLAVLAPDASGRAADAAARAALAGQGLEKYFTHSLGHGVGLAVHEEPRLAGTATAGLVPGNVVTVEPGVYFPGSGGIRVEDMAVIEPGGVRVMSSLPRDEESLIL